MRVIATSTAGYRGAADLIDSMHQLRARFSEVGWNGTSTFGWVGRLTS